MDYDEPSKAKKSKSAPAPSSSGKRLKECPGCGEKVPLSLRECKTCDYQFTSKTMTSSANQGGSSFNSSADILNLRDRFPFEPEKVKRNNINLIIINDVLFLLFIYIYISPQHMINYIFIYSNIFLCYRMKKEV